MSQSRHYLLPPNNGRNEHVATSNTNSGGYARTPTTFFLDLFLPTPFM
jgi:hypothetical protein